MSLKGLSADGRLKRYHCDDDTSAGYFETLFCDLGSGVELHHTTYGEPLQRIYIYQECP
jgi:hypothetical protein